MGMQRHPAATNRPAAATERTWLSTNSTCAQSMPSASYTSCSSRNMCLENCGACVGAQQKAAGSRAVCSAGAPIQGGGCRQRSQGTHRSRQQQASRARAAPTCCCRRSLAKLMHSCSNEFSWKHSKPGACGRAGGGREQVGEAPRAWEPGRPATVRCTGPTASITAPAAPPSAHPFSSGSPSRVCPAAPSLPAPKPASPSAPSPHRRCPGWTAWSRWWRAPPPAPR